MMRSEFIERTGFEPTAEEYRAIEAEYMGTDVDKDQFCKEWKKNGGVQRMMRLRARKIEELEEKIAQMEREYNDMDTRYCIRINRMNDEHREKVAEYEEKLAKVAEYESKLERANESNRNLQALLIASEHKLQTVRDAFSILGIVKEEA